LRDAGDYRFARLQATIPGFENRETWGTPGRREGSAASVPDLLVLAAQLTKAVPYPVKSASPDSRKEHVCSGCIFSKKVGFAQQSLL